ncbi:MAG: UvrB/UvrC motif-containing protein, partial [Candidatus Krumholzibacteriota bacterium]|nr:UvrB/UvrC motif-containing protein [Candidatus Krumholzibacteriota bacterium]
EGLDLPEVTLVAVLDADKEGFLRSRTSLIQTAGRAARHREGMVIFYADKMTGSMERAIEETNRRRERQIAYNEKHGIVPRSIEKSIDEVRLSTSVADARRRGVDADEPVDPDRLDDPALLCRLEEEMWRESEALNFEKAASLRDRIEEIRLRLGEYTKRGYDGQGVTPARGRGARRGPR